MSATVSMNATGKYFVSLLTEQEIEFVQPSLFQVGIDVGLKDFATFFRWNKKIEKSKVASETRRQTHKKHNRFYQDGNTTAPIGRNNAKKGSGNSWKKIVNARTDFLHKITSSLVREKPSDMHRRPSCEEYAQEWEIGKKQYLKSLGLSFDVCWNISASGMVKHLSW
ncbi:hypothetical protein GCM10020331_076700 [Ectobacillus funiculus]